MSNETEPCLNTDVELWREREGDYFANSVHITEQGALGINVGGSVVVRSLEEWHALASRPTPSAGNDVTEEMIAAARAVADGVDDSAFERIYTAMSAARPLGDDATVERVARALCEANEFDWNEMAEKPSFTIAATATRTYWLRQARAAIAALSTASTREKSHDR